MLRLWNLVAELRADSLQFKATYIWGLDWSGTLQGAGGVGGLLVNYDWASTTWLLPAYDGNGNVMALLNRGNSGALAAAYEYDAFGNTLAAYGTHAAANSFRFSTKYTDTETGLVYYGLRYYSPTLGRFINKDPIEEQGGLNLYGFCGNNGVGRWDYLGQDWDDIFEFFFGGNGGSGSSGTYNTGSGSFGVITISVTGTTGGSTGTAVTKSPTTKALKVVPGYPFVTGSNAFGGLDHSYAHSVVASNGATVRYQWDQSRNAWVPTAELTPPTSNATPFVVSGPPATTVNGSNVPAPLTLPDVNTDEGLLARVLLAENFGPAYTSKYNADEALRAMRMEVAVYKNRLASSNPGMFNAPGAQSLADVILAPGQTYGFTRDQSGNLQIAPSILQNIQGLLDRANSGSAAYRQFVQNAIDVATGKIEPLDPFPHLGGLYGFMTQGSSSPGPNFVPVPADAGGIADGQQFYTLKQKTKPKGPPVRLPNMP